MALDSFNRSRQRLIKIKSCHSVFRPFIQLFIYFLFLSKLSVSVECVWILVVVCEDIWTNLLIYCGLSTTICGQWPVLNLLQVDLALSYDH